MNDSLVYLRYWGSYFKDQRQTNTLLAEFYPLIKRGWKCNIVLEKQPTATISINEFEKSQINLIYLPRPQSNWDFRCVLNVYRLCKRLKPHVFHCENMHSSPLIGAFLSNVPVRFWTKHAMNSNFEECRPSTLKERFAFSTRLSCILSTRVIAVSKPVKRELVNLGVAPHRVLVRYNPRGNIELDKNFDRLVERTKLGYSQRDVVITTIGHAVPVKGWDILLEAFSKTSSLVPEARLLLIGSYTSYHESEFFRKLQALILNHNLSEKVKFLGHTQEIFKVLSAADIFAMPSRSEGFCIALIEALQVKLPCISTKVGIAEEVISQGINGSLVDRCNANNFSEALIKLASDYSLRCQYKERIVLPESIPTLEQYSETIATDYETFSNKKVLRKFS